jgi:hypothetical protein
MQNEWPGFFFASRQAEGGGEHLRRRFE